VVRTAGASRTTSEAGADLTYARGHRGCTTLNGSRNEHWLPCSAKAAGGGVHLANWLSEHLLVSRHDHWLDAEALTYG